MKWKIYRIFKTVLNKKNFHLSNFKRIMTKGDFVLHEVLKFEKISNY